MTAPLAVPLDFAIIGAQKSASTFIQHCLALHPHIDISRTESPHFEDPFYGDDSMRSLIAQLGGERHDVRRGIKRPNYLGLVEVPRRLACHAPDTKLVVVLRDPVLRAVSAYRHYVTAGHLGPAPVDSAFRQLLSGDSDPRYPSAHEILEWGRYGEHLHRYREFFSSDRTLVLLQDDIIVDPASVYAETCDFLEVDRGYIPREIHARRNVGAQSAMHLRLSRHRSRLRRRYLADRAAPRRPATRRLSWPYVAALTAIDRYVMPRIPGRLEQPSQLTIAALRSYYQEDIVRTEDLIHRDLAMWS